MTSLDVLANTIIHRLNILLAIIAVSAVMIACAGLLNVFVELRYERAGEQHRDLIDMRNKEVTIIVGECLTTYRAEPLRACVETRLERNVPRK